MPTSDVAQLDLFGGEKPAALASPKLALPFQRSEEVDVPRVARILGVSKRTVRRMCHANLLRAYRTGDIAYLRIEYTSVVEYCDRLCIENHIPNRRGALTGARRRFRDSEILPFPLSETIGVPECSRRLGLSKAATIHLIEEGLLVAYQLLIDTTGCPWRVHAPSFERYLASLHERAATVRPSARTTFRRETSMR